MGNRAVIVCKKDLIGGKKINPNQIGVYLHWNGGRRSVEAFLKYCDLKGYRTPDDDCYGWARLCQVIGNFFGGTLSLGIDRAENLDCNNWDNGVYVIEGWKIVDRLYMRNREQYPDRTVDEMCKAIDESMPDDERIGEDYWNGEDVPIEDIQVGDKVVFPDREGHYRTLEVLGIGADGKICNGSHVDGVPYVNTCRNEHPEDNINNYLARRNTFTGAFEPATVRCLRK